MAAYYKAPTDNFISTTLNGAINDSATTITVNDASKLQAPGVIVIDRQDGNGNNTPGAREVVAYTGISSNDLTGCTRGFDNSTARSHSDGALAETMPTVGMWNDLRDGVAAALSTDGTDLAITGTASIAIGDIAILSATSIETTSLSVTSVASIAEIQTDDLTITTLTATDMALTSIASIGHIAYNASKPLLTTDSDAATVTFDMDASNLHQVTLGGNRTLAFSNTADGQVFIIRLVQDGTGSRTVTWTPAAAPMTIYWAGGTAPTLTTTANKADTFGFITSSASTYDGYIVGQNI